MALKAGKSEPPPVIRLRGLHLVAAGTQEAQADDGVRDRRTGGRIDNLTCDRPLRRRLVLKIRTIGSRINDSP